MSATTVVDNKIREVAATIRCVLSQRDPYRWRRIVRDYLHYMNGLVEARKMLAGDLDKELSAEITTILAWAERDLR